MKSPSKSFVVAMIGIALLAFGVIITGLIFGSQPFSHTSSDRELVSMTHIATAVKIYQSEFSSEPPMYLEQFFDALSGDNPRGINFLSLPEHSISDSGIVIDNWGNPYQVFYGSDGWLIRSAGPNGVFDELTSNDSDDIFIHIPKSE